MIEDSIQEQFLEVEVYIARGEDFVATTVPAISSWSVAQHLDHLLKVCGLVLGSLLKGEALEGDGVNMLGRVVLLTKLIPRGKGESPERVRGEKKSASELLALLVHCRKQLSEWRMKIEKPPENTLILNHPYFNRLNVKQSLRFLTIHNHHHFKIINEIAKRD